MPSITQQDIGAIEQQVKAAHPPFAHLRQELQQVIVGQQELLEGLVIGLLCNGHVLIEGVPGLAKTTAVATLAAALRTSFHRIQFTPDLLPSDLVGTMVYSPATHEFSVKKGPIFANIVLADEINRAPAKVQSALLEAMQEKQVTIGEQSFPLPAPFFVLATQNPLEQEGTYPLPEAQLDRFMMKVVMDYPSEDEELRVLDLAGTTEDMPVPAPFVDLATIQQARTVVNNLYLDDKVKRYIVRLVHATRRPDAYGVHIAPLIRVGASPRATINLTLAAKAYAFLKGRGYVTPQDVKSIGMDVLRHRVAITYEAEAEEKTSETVVQKIFDELPVP